MSIDRGDRNRTVRREAPYWKLGGWLAVLGILFEMLKGMISH